MAKQQTDDELNLRRKARRRLIGAIALTLAVVVILPMVLDSEPKPTGQDIELRIPAPDKVGEFVPGLAASEVAETVPLAGSDVASAPVAASAVAVVAAEAVAAASSPQMEASGKIQTAASKQPEAKSAESSPPEQKASESKTPESRTAESRSPGKADGAESFVAQIGAYSNADTAKREVDKLKKWGFKAYTEKVGNKIRVRVGPYAERDKADKVRKLLEKHGLHPVIVSVK